MKKIFIILVILASVLFARECGQIKKLTNNLDITCKDGLYGLSLKNGKQIIPNEFKLLKDFQLLEDGFVYVREYDNKARDANKNLLCYLLGSDGKIIHKSRFLWTEKGVFDDLWVVRDEYTKDIKDGTSMALLDKNGNFIVPFGKYLNINLLRDKNKIYIKKRDYKHYLKVAGYKSFLKKGNHYGRFLEGLIAKNGKEIIPPMYYKIQELSKDLIVGEGIDETFSLFDANGTLLFQSDKYRWIKKGIDKETILVALKNNRHSIIDIKTQKNILEANLITPIVKNAWKVQEKEGFKVINSKLETIIDSSTISHVQRFSSLQGFGYLMGVDRKGKGWGIITNEGKVVIPMKYKDFYRPRNDASMLSILMFPKRSAVKGGGAIYFAHENDKNKEYDIYCFISYAKTKDYKEISKFLSDTSHKRYIFDRYGNIVDISAYSSVKIISPFQVEVKNGFFSKAKIIVIK